MTIELGRYNRLPVTKILDFGLYVDGDEDGEILLPKRYIPAGTKEGDVLDVFIYLDQQERLIATTQKPLAQAGEFAYLRVNWTNRHGAFLDWGLMKDLFVPFKEQREKMVRGMSYVVYCYVDEQSFRLMASARVDKFLSRETPDFLPGEEVDILVWQKTDLGYKVIAGGRYGGMLYDNEVFQPLRIGKRLKAFVKKVREDGKLDLALQKSGPEKVDNFAETLLAYVRAHDGATSFGDKSAAEDIYKTFGVSKRTFKKAVGELYKMQLISLSDQGIELRRDAAE